MSAHKKVPMHHCGRGELVYPLQQVFAVILMICLFERQTPNPNHFCFLLEIIAALHPKQVRLGPSEFHIGVQPQALFPIWPASTSQEIYLAI